MTLVSASRTGAAMLKRHAPSLHRAREAVAFLSHAAIALMCTGSANTGDDHN